jgi:hypothetical protein
LVTEYFRVAESMMTGKVFSACREKDIISLITRS